MFHSSRHLRLVPFVSVLALSWIAISPARAQPVSSSVAAANKAELVQLVDEYVGNDIWPSKIVKTFNFNLSASAWKVMLSADGVKGASGVARDFGDYLVEQKLGDLEATESANNDRKANQGDVDELLAEVKGKLVLSVEATQPKLSPAQSDLLLRYFTYLGGFPEDKNWTPRGGRANLKLIFSSSAKDVAVSASKDATNFTVIAPAREVPEWTDKIERGLRRFGK